MFSGNGFEACFEWVRQKRFSGSLCLIQPNLKIVFILRVPGVLDKGSSKLRRTRIARLNTGSKKIQTRIEPGTQNDICPTCVKPRAGCGWPANIVLDVLLPTRVFFDAKLYGRFLWYLVFTK